MNRAVFLDRDGVINRKAPEGDYITRLEELEFLPGAAEAIGTLNRSGFKVIVVTNQRCVAKDLITEKNLNLLHEQMLRNLAASGAIIDAIYCCPHDKTPVCACRKPAPGMLLTAAREHDINLSASWMIGDSDSDVEAGIRAGCLTAKLSEVGQNEKGKANLHAHSLFDAVQQIVMRGLPTDGTKSLPGLLVQTNLT